MNSLFDFITHVKGVEYIVALLFIGGYILYWEVLKPKPFKALVNTAKEDLDHIKKDNYREAISIAKKMAAAPFIGLAYVVILPVSFFYALGSAVINGILGFAGKEASFGWRPTEAYLGGKKSDKKKDDVKAEKNK